MALIYSLAGNKRNFDFSPFVLGPSVFFLPVVLDGLSPQEKMWLLFNFYTLDKRLLYFQLLYK